MIINEEKLDDIQKNDNNDNQLNNNININNEEEMKKNLIQKEIIDRNYNKDSFIDFCCSRNFYISDLSQLSYNELESIINEYVNIHLKEDYNSNLNLSKLQEEKFKIKNEIDKLNQLKNIKNNLNNKKCFKSEIQCQKIQKSILNDRQITITLRNPKLIETSLFKSDYIIYEVYTDFNKWKVFRRYKNFLWLKEILKKLYPGYVIPPLPSKKIGSRRFEKDFINKRMKFLNYFINDICKNELYKSSDILISFLSTIDNEKFENEMRIYDSLIIPKLLKDYSNLEGKIKIKEENSNFKYENIANYFNLQSQLLEKINFNLKNFYINLNAACMNLDEVRSGFETITEINLKIGMKEEISKTYEKIGIFFKNWRRVLLNQNEIINSNIRIFYKYTNMKYKSYQELIHEREEKRSEYLTELNKLNNKKENFWKDKNINKWEIKNNNDVDYVLLLQNKNYAFSKMCTKDNEKLEILHNQVYFYNYMIEKQLKILIKDNRITFIDNIKEFTKEFYITLNDALNTWTELGNTFND